VGGHHTPCPIADHPPRKSSQMKQLLPLLTTTENSIVEGEFRLNI
jgi:protein-tyrosine phosphatase